MCNPIAVIAGVVGAVAGKKKAESDAKKEQKAISNSNSELNKSEETKQNIISNPLIPDTFQARVRLGDTRSYSPQSGRSFLDAITGKPEQGYVSGRAGGSIGGIAGLLLGQKDRTQSKALRSAGSLLLGRRR